MPAIDIKRVNGQVVFDPPILVIANNDIVFWRNFDPQEQHWITKQGAAPNFWFAAPMAPFVNGRPPDTTSALVVHTADTYVCSLHGEHGSFTLTPPAIG
jgi:hypothetical protein